MNHVLIHLYETKSLYIVVYYVYSICTGIPHSRMVVVRIQGETYLPRGGAVVPPLLIFYPPDVDYSFFLIIVITFLVASSFKDLSGFVQTPALHVNGRGNISLLLFLLLHSSLI